MLLAGKVTLADGSVSEGEFNDDLRHGNGERRDGEETERAAGREKTRFRARPARVRRRVARL